MFKPIDKFLLKKTLVYQTNKRFMKGDFQFNIYFLEENFFALSKILLHSLVSYKMRLHFAGKAGLVK